MSSPPGTNALADAREFYALVTAIDEAAADTRRWPAVASQLAAVLSLDPNQLPQVFPHREDVDEFVRAASAKVADTELSELLRFICSRLIHAAEMHRKIALSKVTSRAATRALNHSLRAILLVDRTAKIITSNAWADEIFAQQDGLVVQAGYLRASTSNDDVQLRRAIEIMSSRKFRWLSLSISRCHSPEILNLVLAPTHTMMRSQDQEDIIVITITCRSRKVALDPDVLTRMYGLTRSEASLACCLASGDSLEQGANRLDISLNTARTHLKRIFMKTETNRQSQLVLLLMQHTHATNLDYTRYLAGGHGKSERDRRLFGDQGLSTRDIEQPS